MARNNHSRAVDDAIALVGHARPHLVDAWDALALLEASGYTDARVNRELGLRDTRELAEVVYARLSDRPLPPSAVMEGTPEAAAPGIGTTLLMAAAWAVAVLALLALVQVPLPVVPLALVPSVVVCCGFVEAMRRRGVFYAGLGHLWLGRVTCWYFMRLAAFAVAAVMAAGICGGWLAGAGWPRIALWADAFVMASALWLVAGAVQVPGMLSKREHAGRGPGAPIPIPRMTVVAYRELPVLLGSSLCALLVGGILDVVLARANYAAVETVVGACALTFVVSTIAARASGRTRAVNPS
jgi:hypothetical protein